MRAVSISVKAKKEVMEYKVKWQKNPGGEELQCKSCEFPRPELLEALEGFAEYIPIICLIPKNCIRYLTIAGATFVYDDKAGTAGVELGVQLELTNGFGLEFKSPVKRLDRNNPDLEESTRWEDRYTKQANKLEEEILLYAQGKRAQTELVFEEENDEEAGA